MLNKVIATAMSVALLANVSMISSANDSYADISATTETGAYLMSADAETEEASTSVETTVVSSGPQEETTTTATEATTPADVGAAVRKSLDVKLRDVIYFPDGVRLADSKNNWKVAKSGEKLYLVGIDDWNQRFRVYVPRLNDKENTTVYYLTYADAATAKLHNHEGYIVGDLDNNFKINAVDFVLMKRGFLYEWDDTLEYLMSDMDADGKLTITDVVLMQRWLLGVK